MNAAVQNLREPTMRDWLTLGAVGVLVFILNIDYTAVNLALIAISRDINADLNHLQWLLSGYVLIWGAIVIPAGRCTDIYGKKTTILFGLFLFVSGSLLVAVGDQLTVLVAGRLIQGVGGAIYAPACYAVIFAIMPQHRQGLAMGLIGAASGLGLAAGPSIAGLILDHISWRWIFFMNLPLGLVTFTALYMLIAKDQRSEIVQKIDLTGASLLSVGIGLFVFTLNQIEVWGLYNPLLWSCGIGSILALILFNMWDRNHRPQTLPRHFFYNKPYMSSVGSIFLMCYNFSMLMLLIGLYLQAVKRYSSIDAGLIFLMMTLIMGVLSPLGGKLADHMPVRIPIIIGIISMLVSTILLTFLTVDSSLTYIIICLIFAGIGLGLSFPTLNTALMRAVRQDEVATASSIFSMSSLLGHTLGIIAASNILIMGGSFKLDSFLNNFNIQITGSVRNKLLDILGQADHSINRFQDFAIEHRDAFMHVIDEAFMAGFKPCMMTAAISAIIGIIWIWRNLNINAVDNRENVTPTVPIH